MSDDRDDEERVKPTTFGLPIITGSDGQTYMPTCNIVYLLRAIADSSRNLADDPDCDLTTLADTLDIEADALEVRGIAHTTPTL